MECKYSTMKTEAQLLAFTRRLCDSLSILFVRLSSPARKGIPDCMLIDSRLIYFVELKSPAGTGRLSALQRRYIQRLRGYGAIVFVLHDPRDVETIIKLMRTDTEKAIEHYKQLETEL